MIRKLAGKQAGRKPAIYYPESDGKPLGETGFHVDCTLTLYGVLQWYYRLRRPDIHVACDMFFYYEEDNPNANKAPDVMVTPGVGGHTRRTFKTWEEQAVPCTIFEIVSKDSRKEDTVEKPVLYARLGIREYFIYDPVGEARLKPRFQGFHLHKGRFVPMKANSDGGFTSKELGLRFTPEEHRLRVIVLDTDERLPYLGDLEEQVEEEKLRAAYLAKVAAEAETRAAEAANRAAEEKARATDAESRAAEEKARAAEAATRAAEEKRRADALQEELDQLKRKVRKRRKRG